VTPLPTPDNAPCAIGQLKGDKSTMNLYFPGQPGYNDLHSNVQCFNTLDAATTAGFHIPAR
jgi:hypothetical protein